MFGNHQPAHRLAPDIRSFGGVMNKDKSILEKITDTVKDIATIAANAADHALKAEESPLKVDRRSAAYIPLAADGLVSDPVMVPPPAGSPAPRRKRAAAKRAANKANKANKTAKKNKAVKKSAGKAVKRAAAKKSKKAAKKTARKTNRKAARRAAKKTRKGIR